MQYVDGETLNARLNTARIDVRGALDVALQVARALVDAHERGIIHRDIKPQNIVVSKNGQVKVLDFGIATVVSPPSEELGYGRPLLDTGAISGTVPYMSPEQLSGAPFDHRTDIFSLGVVLHEIVSGRHPFATDNAGDTMSAILHDEPRPLDSESISVPVEVRRIIHKCLEKDPTHRYRTTRDLVIDLEAVTRQLMEGAAAVGSAAPSPAPGSSALRRPARLRITAFASSAIVMSILFALAGDGLRERFRAATATTRIQSVAVLPLTNLSGDPEEEYFADGMTEALITELAQVRGLRVPSRASAMMFKGAQKPLPQIGRELKVDAVLLGSVQTGGSRVLVTTQLVHAASDRHLWARSYERDLKEVLSLQKEIARTVLAEVHVALLPDAAERLAKANNVDPEVHQLYLKGRFHFNKGIEQEIDKGIQYFIQAIEKAPTYAPAHAGLADSYALLSDDYRAPGEVMPRAKAAGQRALALDESLGEGHVSLGSVLLRWDRDWAGAERELKRAIDLQPSSGYAHYAYADFLSALGRHDDAIAEIRTAQQYDPLSLNGTVAAGIVYFFARRFDQAIVEFRKAVELEPRYSWSYAGLAISYAAEGRKEEALALAGKARQADDDPMVLATAGGVYPPFGELAQARRVLAKLGEIGKHRYVCPYEVAIIHLGLGETDGAFELLERGFRERSKCMIYTRVDPRLDSVRSDARYADLVRRLAFPQ